MKNKIVFHLTAFILLSTAACKNKNTSNTDSGPLTDSNSQTLMRVKNNENETMPMHQTADTGNHPSESSLISNPQDSMLSQLKNLSSMFGGKNDSGLLKNFGGGNMDTILKKMQSMMGGTNGNMGEAIGNKILNLQLGQMKDNNPLKQVANEMMKAQQNGTAGPSKTYTATYAPEQPSNYTVPVSGSGNTIMLQYTGGTMANNKKDGLWKNIYTSSNKANNWNVYSEGYAESSVVNMKIHSASLAGINENYYIILNEQYKKYNKQQRNDAGKNESDVQVQKIGNEKLFGYNCIHIKISYTLKALGQTSKMQDDEWYSADVPGAQFLSPLIFENHSPAIVKKIIDTGCAGVLVKSIIKSSGSSQLTQLIQLSSITQKDMPDSMFTLPANYQEDKNTSLYDIQ